MNAFEATNLYLGRAASIMQVSSSIVRLFETPQREVKVGLTIEMDNGDVALALLNRGAADVAPISVDLTQFGYAPATPVYVRDVWAATTSGPFTGSFSSRAVASHETVLLRLMLAKPGGEAEL